MTTPSRVTTRCLGSSWIVHPWLVGFYLLSSPQSATATVSYLLPWSLAVYARCQVISCVTKASACHHTRHANHRHRSYEFLAIIGIKDNIKTFNYVCRLIVNMFYCGGILFHDFKHADIKSVRQRVTSAKSLADGYCEATIPVLKGHHVT